MAIPQGILTNNCYGTIMSATSNYYGFFGGDIYGTSVPTNAFPIPISTTIRAIGIVVAQDYTTINDVISLRLHNLTQTTLRAITITEWGSYRLLVQAIAPFSVNAGDSLYFGISFGGDITQLDLIQTFALYDLISP